MPNVSASVETQAHTFMLKAEGLVNGSTISLNSPDGKLRLAIPKAAFPLVNLNPDDMVVVTLGLAKVNINVTEDGPTSSLILPGSMQ